MGGERAGADDELMEEKSAQSNEDDGADGIEPSFTQTMMKPTTGEDPGREAAEADDGEPDDTAQD